MFGAPLLSLEFHCTPFAATHKIVVASVHEVPTRGPTLRFYEKRTKGVVSLTESETAAELV